MRTLSPLTTWSIRPLSSAAMADFFTDFERIANAIAVPSYANTVGFQPSCDISETKDHYLVSFDLPGVKAEDVKIEVQENQLMISGERHHEAKNGTTGAMVRHGRAYGKFERTFTLPTSVNSEKIEAQFENGVLNIALPKAETAKPRLIQIQSGKPGFFGKLLGTKKEADKDEKETNREVS